MPTDAVTFHLRDAMKILWRQKWVIFVVVMLSVGSALALSLRQTPLYSAAATVVVASQTQQPLVNPQTGAAGGGRLDSESELEFVRSDEVRQRAQEDLDFQAKVAADATDQGGVLRFTAESRDPRRAALAANTFAEAYVAEKQDISTAAYAESIQLIEQERDGVREELGRARQPIVAKQDEIAAAIAEEQRIRLEGELASLQLQLGPTVQALESQESDLSQELLDIQRQSSVVADSGPRVTRAATVPSNPDSPKPERDVALAFVGGLILGVGLAFLIDYLDDSVKTADDLERALAGVPVIGMVPEHRRSAKRDELEVLVEPRSPAAEAYRSLRTSVELASINHPISVLLVTGATQGEGKTTVASNLAVTFGSTGKRVVLVSCDLRAPALHRLFKVPNETGFTSLLLGESVADAIHRTKGLENLVVMTSGPPPPDPAELLGSKRTGEVLAALASQADLVILDTAPILPVGDTLALSRHADAVLFVSKRGKSSRRAVQRAAKELRRYDAQMLGAVLTMVPAGETYGGYGYGYAYDEGPDESEQSKSWWGHGRKANGGQPADTPSEPVGTSGPASSQG